MGFKCRKVIALAAGVLALSAVAGCGENGRFSLTEGLNTRGQNEGTARTTRAAGRTVGEDVEAPEVFSVTEKGLWDGRPSLGGIWVAHPDVSEPERVIIRNASSGTSVVGALFRRERDVPGPLLQISSDAANALGMVAGAPQELDVTALRRKEVPVEQADPQETVSVEAPEDVTEALLKPVDIADTAISAETD